MHFIYIELFGVIGSSILLRYGIFGILTANPREQRTYFFSQHAIDLSLVKFLCQIKFFKNIYSLYNHYILNMTLFIRNCLTFVICIVARRDREYLFFQASYVSWNWKDEGILYLRRHEIFSMHFVRHDDHEESRKRSASLYIPSRNLARQNRNYCARFQQRLRAGYPPPRPLQRVCK